jgi:anti-anti-sigma regulatory factor
MPFSIFPVEPGVTRVSLEGDLDAFTTELLRPELDGVVRRRPIHVEVDLSRLRWVDNRAMEVLVAFFASLARDDCRITVLGLKAQPLRSFKAALIDAIQSTARFIN